MENEKCGAKKCTPGREKTCRDAVLVPAGVEATAVDRVSNTRDAWVLRFAQDYREGRSECGAALRLYGRGARTYAICGDAPLPTRTVETPPPMRTVEARAITTSNFETGANACASKKDFHIRQYDFANC